MKLNHDKFRNNPQTYAVLTVKKENQSIRSYKLYM